MINEREKRVKIIKTVCQTSSEITAYFYRMKAKIEKVIGEDSLKEWNRETQHIKDVRIVYKLMVLTTTMILASQLHFHETLSVCGLFIV